MTESMLVFLSSAEVATCAVSGAETKSDSGEANNKDLDHSLFSVAVEIWTLLGADTKSDSGEANESDSDQVARLLPIAYFPTFSNFDADTKSDSGDAKDKMPDQCPYSLCISLLEKSDAVDMPLKRLALQCLMAFST